ncbi:MAG: hypothetical protein WBQ66_19345, partial [Blastocatellia bacterium]
RTTLEHTAGRSQRSWFWSHGLRPELKLPVGPVDNVRKAPVEMPASLFGDVAEWLKAAVC